MLATRKVLLLSLVISLGFFIYISWPLPKYILTGIPSSGDNIEGVEARSMIRGDHLQLMYRLWLCADYFTGETPWFYNMYEFNTGDDENRYVPRAHHFPFPLSFKAGELLINQAFGWNGTIFITVWISLFLTWLTLRRYCKSDYIALLSSIFSILLPYKWLSIFAGSPTGFAMMWIPGIWLGLDMAFCDNKTHRRLKGGLLAGLSLLFAAFCDSHVYFFALLMSPPLALLCLLRAPKKRFKGWKNLLAQGLLSGGIYALFGLISIAYGQFKKSAISASGAGGVRNIHEVRLFSPNWREYLHFQGDHVYLGTLLMLLLALGSLYILYRILRKQSPLPFAIEFLIITLGISACLMLGYGTEGPFGFAPITLARKFIPMFEMIRQPPKIFCLLPMLIAAWMALLLYEGKRSGRLPLLWKTAPLLLLTWWTIEYGNILNPTICLLDDQQAAYASVREDADKKNNTARALILPLWPGSDAWSSLYEHYSSIYRIRMANGYSPVTPVTYKTDFFDFFNSINQGYIRDVQLDDLLARGIQYLLLHENAFPQKVSAFPPGFTLNRLQTHPRLTPLKNDNGVWAFRIEPHPQHSTTRPPPWDWAFPSRKHEMEHFRRFNCEKTTDPTASGNHYIRLEKEGQRIAPTRTWSIQPQSNQVFSIRARGTGSYWVKTTQGQQTISMRLLHIDAQDWTWINLPLDWITTFGRTGFNFSHQHGHVDLDMGLLLYGNAPRPNKNPITINADRFFHQGITQGSAILLRPRYNRPTSVINGLNLPLQPGTYQFTLKATSQAAPGTHLINFYLAQNDHILQHLEIHQDSPTTFTATIPDNRPVRLSIHYPRKAEILIQNITIIREK